MYMCVCFKSVYLCYLRRQLDRSLCASDNSQAIIEKEQFIIILLLVYKYVNNLALEYLSSLLVPHMQKHYCLGLNIFIFFRLPSPDTELLTTEHYGAVVEWNQLPVKLKQSPFLHVFKSMLKTHLFHECYG